MRGVFPLPQSHQAPRRALYSWWDSLLREFYQVLANLCDDDNERADVLRYRLISLLTEMHTKQSRSHLQKNDMRFCL